MDNYYVNKNAQLNGDHEVHRSGCGFMPAAQNQQYLGVFTNCADAVRKAKEYFRQSNGCAFCSSTCHTT